MKKRSIVVVLALICMAAVFAACTERKPEYQVVYMNGGEVFYTATVEEDSAIVLPESDPQKEEDDTYTYTFKGWSLTEGGEIEDLTSVTAVTEDLTYYAVFEPAEKAVYYTVTFKDGLTGEQIGEPQSVLSGGSAEAPAAPEHEGYTFKGWDKDFTNITVRTEVTAQYSRNSYTLTLDVLGAEQTQTAEFEGSLEIAAPAAPGGLVFEGWYVQESEESEPQLLTEKYPNGMPASDVSAYALFAIDWSGVGLNEEDLADPVYGGSVGVSLPVYESVAFSYKWGDGTYGENTEKYVWTGAGTQTVSVSVTAVFENDAEYRIAETRTFEETVQVGKAPLAVTVKVADNSLAYGTLPEVTFEYSGFIGGDGEIYGRNIKAVFYNRSLGETADGAKLPTGEYAVSAELPGQDDYELNVTAAQLLVKPKELALQITVGDITYGEEARPSVYSGGFAYGEDISVLSGGSVVFEKDGAAVSGILPAGTYTARTAGYRSANYTVVQGQAEFNVDKAFLTVTVKTDGQYTYADAVTPSAEYDESGLVNGDAISSVITGEPEFVYKKGGQTVNGILPVGSYSVTVQGIDAANYSLQITEAAFTVTAREVGLHVSETQKSGTAWKKSDWLASDFSAAYPLPEGFTLVGTLVLDALDADTYTLSGTSTDGSAFRWSEEAGIFYGGENVTANFVIRYDIAVTLEEVDFSIGTVSDFYAAYTGGPIELGSGIEVNDRPEGFKIEYKLGEGGVYSEQMPTAIDADTYEVWFRLSAPNYVTYENSYHAIIQQAANKIAPTAEFGPYTYNGQDQSVAFNEHLKADFGDIVLKEGGGDVFVFRNAGSYSFTVCVAETPNFAGAEFEVSFTVAKADYLTEQIPEQKLAEGAGEIVAGVNKTLAGVLLAEGFQWTEPSAGYKGGENTFAATYCGDPQNYNAAQVSITFTARKEKITVSADSAALEADFGIQSFDLYGALSAAGENGETFDLLALSELCTAEFDTPVDFATGGTFAVKYSAKESDYYTVIFESTSDSDCYAPFKLKSAKIGDVYYTIEDALAAAQSGQTVIVTADTAFASAETAALLNGIYSAEGGHYTVKAGVTLLVPYGEADLTGNNAEYVEGETPTSNPSEPGDPYVTLFVEHNIVNEGTLIVGAVTGVAAAGYYNQGMITGGYARIELGAQCELQTSGTLSVYGQIVGGGTVSASGGTVRERMEIPDWRGGTAAAATFLGSQSVGAMQFLSGGEWTPDSVNEFPFKEYELNSIQTKLKMDCGTTYSGISRIFTSEQKESIITIPARFTTVDFNLIGSADGAEALIRLQSGASAVKEWGEERTALTITGGAVGGVAELRISLLEKEIVMDTGRTAFPITGNLDIVLKDGTYFSDYAYKLLPGANLTVENAFLTLNNKFIVYKESDINYSVSSETYTQGRGDAVLFIKADGSLVINGAFGGRVSGESGALVQTGADASVSAQATEGTGTQTLHMNWIVDAEIEFTYTATSTINNVAQLQKAGGTFTDMAVGTAYRYSGTEWTAETA